MRPGPMAISRAVPNVPQYCRPRIDVYGNHARSRESGQIVCSSILLMVLCRNDKEGNVGNPTMRR
jgi:hypothetical protein